MSLSRFTGTRPAVPGALQGLFPSVLLGVALATLGFLLQRPTGVDLGDEGFVWYGAIGTAGGEVPLRDFRSYDPGWYYWSAAWFKLLGSDGVVALRLAAAGAQAVGLAAVLLTLSRTPLGLGYRITAGLLHVLWMFGVPGAFNATVSLVAVAMGAALVEHPTRGRHFLAGVTVGVAAFLGRNHGVYCAVAFLALIVFVQATRGTDGLGRLGRRVAAWVGGMAVGYSPMLLMCLVIPGFAGAFVDSVAFWLRIGVTNLPRPVPWPWSGPAHATLEESARAASLGLWFLILPIVLVASLLLVLHRRQGRPPSLVAATFVGIVYLHYTFSRPDLSHVSRGAVHPLIVAALGLLSVVEPRKRRAVGVGSLAVLAALSLLAVGTRHPAYSMLRWPAKYQQISVAGEALWTERSDAALIRAAKKVKAETEGDLFVAYLLPGLYPVLGQRSPLWDTYFLLPETVENQKLAIRELKKKRVN